MSFAKNSFAQRSATNIHNTGLCIWDASVVLHDFIRGIDRSLIAFPDNAICVELGCGVAPLPTFAALDTGLVSHAIVTDRESTSDSESDSDDSSLFCLLNKNVAASGFATQIDVCALDWACRNYDPRLFARPIALILASDCVFTSRGSRQLVRTLATLGAHQTQPPLILMSRERHELTSNRTNAVRTFQRESAKFLRAIALPESTFVLPDNSMVELLAFESKQAQVDSDDDDEVNGLEWFFWVFSFLFWAVLKETIGIAVFLFRCFMDHHRQLEPFFTE